MSQLLKAFLLGLLAGVLIGLRLAAALAGRVVDRLRGHRALRPLLLAAAAGVGGCSHMTIPIPNGAPMMLTRAVTVHRPFVRQHDQWVQSDQDGEAQVGEVVQFLPATRPAK